MRALATGIPLALILLAVAMFPERAQSQAHSFQDVIQQCEHLVHRGPLTRAQEIEGAYCAGMIHGIAAIMVWNCLSLQGGVPVPPYMTTGGIPSLGAGAQAIINYGRANPQNWDMPPADGAALAISISFPCEH